MTPPRFQTDVQTDILLYDLACLRIGAEVPPDGLDVVHATHHVHATSHEGKGASERPTVGPVFAAPGRVLATHNAQHSSYTCIVKFVAQDYPGQWWPQYRMHGTRGLSGTNHGGSDSQSHSPAAITTAAAAAQQYSTQQY